MTITNKILTTDQLIDLIGYVKHSSLIDLAKTCVSESIKTTNINDKFKRVISFTISSEDNETIIFEFKFETTNEHICNYWGILGNSNIYFPYCGLNFYYIIDDTMIETINNIYQILDN